MIKVKWDCPTCSGKNTDDYEEATLLVCVHCDSEAEWEGILTDKQRKAFDRPRNVSGSGDGGRPD